MIELIKVNKEDRTLLYNIFQKMLYEMTQFYDNDMDEYGNIQYGYFDEYFIDKKRIAYFINKDNELVGFIMVHPYSYFNDEIDYNLAEFTIFPKYRRKGYGAEAVKLLFKKHPGIWEIKYNTKNIKAVNFWTKVTSKYNSSIIEYDTFEKVLKFNIGDKNETK